MNLSKPSTPIPGYWYSVEEGRLFNVRALVLSSDGTPPRVVIENIEGVHRTVALDTWNTINPTLHSPVLVKVML